MEPLELIVFVGIQASGKTTFFRRHMQDRFLHVSLDNWRGKGNVRPKEHEAILAGLAQAAGSGGQLSGVVVDNTNTTATTRQRYFEYANEFATSGGQAVRALAYYFRADLAACLRRNESRPAPQAAPPGEPYFVPPQVIAGYSQRLEAPSCREGFERVWAVDIVEDGRFQVSLLESRGPDMQGGQMQR